MIYKDVVEEDEDDSSLIPLLKHLPKDFGGDPTHFDNDDDAGDFETPLVAAVVSLMRAMRDGLDVNDDEEEDGEGFETFVVRSTVRSAREGSGGEGWDVWREMETAKDFLELEMC
ncbi:hypothetical protein GOBAR_DD00873 [Gossypium barbadense]|nr:hypothetical protein GOBAR_DD00873 [Gossypium barbadense]